MLWWVRPKHARWYFSPAIDPNRRLQFAYGIFAMSMAFTDALCRFIPHPLFAWVHPAFFLTTILIAVGLGPRVTFLFFRELRRGKNPLGATISTPLPAQ